MSNFAKSNQIAKASEPVFIVELERFRGPLDVLLEMVQKRKLSINEVSLAKVADEFAEFAKKVPLSLKQISEFADIASVLLLIKAKSLLPNFELTPQEQEQVQELTQRLQAYKLFKEALAKHKPSALFAPKSPQPMPVEFVPQENLTVGLLLQYALEIISRSKQEDIPQAKVVKRISLQHAISKLISEISTGNRVRLKKLVKGRPKIEAVTYFLAALELVRTQNMQAIQHDDDIELVSESVDVPRYL